MKTSISILQGVQNNIDCTKLVFLSMIKENVDKMCRWEIKYMVVMFKNNVRLKDKDLPGMYNKQTYTRHTREEPEVQF